MDNETNQNGYYDDSGNEFANPANSFNPNTEESSATQENNSETIRVDTTFYKRIGFYCAFNQNPQEAFRKALNELQRSIERSINNLKDEFNSDVERFSIRKTEAREKANEIKNFIDNYEKEIPELERQLDEFRDLYKDLQQDIKRVVIEIGSKKETLIRDRQNALLEELTHLNDELEAIVRKRMAINEEIFIKQKDVLDKKRKFWQELFEKYYSEHQDVLNRLKIFSLSGFYSLGSGFLYNAGFVSAGIAGAFFASFAEANLFASGGILSFITQSLFTFSTQFVEQSLDNYPLEPVSKKVVYAGILLGMSLILLALIFLTSWLCQHIYEKLLGNTSNKNEQKTSIKVVDNEHIDNSTIEINVESEHLPVKAKLSEKSFLGFWIKIMPSLLFIIIGFLLISLGTNTNSLTNLDASIAGYGIGFFIALGSAGILYIYLTMVIEKRLENHIDSPTNSSSPSRFWLNIELSLFILVFIATIVIILIYFQHPFKGIDQVKSLASLMLFTVCSLLTAFTLGFGIRLQSLEMSRELLEINCDIIQTKIIHLSRPLQIYLTKDENRKFNIKFLLIRDEVMNLILSKTKLTKEALNAPLTKKPEFRIGNRFFGGFKKWFKKLYQDRPEENDDSQDTADIRQSDEPFTASDEIKICFPKLEAELGALETKETEVRKKITSTEKEISYRKERKGDFYAKKLKELEDQEKRFRNYHKAISNREKDFHQKTTAQTQIESAFIQKIKEGYELGNWFVEHNHTGTVIPEIK